MSSTAKQLKAVRELVKRKQWDDVLDQAQSIIKDDPKSFHAYVLSPLNSTPIIMGWHSILIISQSCFPWLRIGREEQGRGCRDGI